VDGGRLQRRRHCHPRVWRLRDQADPKLTLAEFLTIIGGYYAAGLVGGATAGALKELGRTWTGTALMGMGVGVPVFLALGTMAFGSPLAWGRTEWAVYGFDVLVLGPLFAVYYRYRAGD